MIPSSRIVEFVHETSFDDLSEAVVRMAERCCLDIIGTAAAGRHTELSRIVTSFVEDHFGARIDVAEILFSGRQASPPGAALASGMTIDSVDAHDGHSLTKGHAGAAVFPAVFSFASCTANAGNAMTGREFLASLAIGYEISIRAGICLHATACDYHTSGAWNAIGCAAVGARYLGLSRQTTRDAFGVAEYHGPRSQMMRCIDHPTMLKDGSGWGAMAGLSAAYLANNGFTGAPAVTLEYREAQEFWEGLGDEWEFLNQYFKPYPVCRWAQPAIAAVDALLAEHSIDPEDVLEIRVATFHEALRLAGHQPDTTEEAQYAIAFPVAALVVCGELGVEQLIGSALKDERTLTLSRKVLLIEKPEYNDLFPAERWADVSIALASGEVLHSPPTCPPGDPEWPLTDDAIGEKFERLSSGSLGTDVIRAIRAAVAALKGQEQSTIELARLLSTPIDRFESNSS